MTPDEHVALLRSKVDRADAMRALLGSVNARELRDVVVTEEVFQALVRGTRDPNPSIRWWSVQLLDHCPDVRAFDAIAPLLADQVPRVRRNAAHALGCLGCKPALGACSDPEIIARLRESAANDENAKVRRQATIALTAISA